MLYEYYLLQFRHSVISGVVGPFEMFQQPGDLAHSLPALMIYLIDKYLGRELAITALYMNCFN